MLKPLGIKIAVISNSSLIWDREVREELSKADWISLKVDAVNEKAWRRINRPHPALRLEEILDGILEFSRSHKGQLATETMLVKGINDDQGSLQQIADFLAMVQPAKAYLSVPTRPPAEDWVQPPLDDSINLAYQIFCRRLEQVELLVRYEGNLFALTGDVEQDLLSITAVHPMREEAVKKFLEQAGKGWDAAQRLIDAGQLVETQYGGQRFYLRRPRVLK
jgi:wyosine [tRNA(Phe)-imidazoG37] synthetase (radical SAM superfamily)